MANCPSCHKYFDLKQKAIDHINRYHADELDELHWTAAQWLYASTHNGSIEGKCMVCGRPTMWNAQRAKPYKLCDDPKCKATIKSQYDKNLKAKTGLTQTELMSDMDHQKELLSNRRIAGRYRFQDGGEVEYVAKLELNFLQFCDKVMNLKSKEILPSPDVFKYFDPKDGKEHSYVPDFYLSEYDLLVEVKDKANMNPAFLEETRYKVVLKDEAMKRQNKYNYIRISGTNYGPFLEILYKITHSEDRKDPKNRKIIVISENADGSDLNLKEPHIVAGFGMNNTPKFIGVTYDNNTYYISDFDKQDVYVVLKDADIINNDTTLRFYEFNGRGDLDSVLTTYKAFAVNPDSALEWNLLELLKKSQIAFNDNGMANNDMNKTDFSMIDVGYNPPVVKEDDDE